MIVKNTFKNKIYSISLSLLLGLLPLIVNAEDDDDEGWSFEILVGAERAPTYVGSDSYVTEADGDFQISYETEAGNTFFLGLGELGAEFQLSESWFLRTVLEYEEGRDNSEDPILAAFPEVEDTIEGQFTLGKKIGGWTIAGVFQPDLLDRGKGLVYFVALGYEHDFSRRLSLETTLDISFADSEHMNTEVGISEEVAAASGLSAYEADSGYKSTSLALTLEYAMTKNLELLVGVEAEFYGSNIADSPLVKDEGSDTTYELGIGLQYSF